MARYWSDGYGETEQVGDAASYNVTVIDRVRWDNKQDKLYFDNAPTLGSDSPVTSDGIARAMNEVREYVRQKDNELFYIDVVTQDGIEVLRDKTYIDIHEAYKSGDTLILRFADCADKCAYFYDFQGNVFRFVLFEATNVLSMYTYWISPDDLLHVEMYSAPYKRPNPETFAITYGEDSVVYDGSKHASVNIPKVPAWALNSTKPKYTASEVGAEEKGIAASRVSAHNSNADAHADIRNMINNVVNMFNSYVTQEQFQQAYNYTQTNAANINQLRNDAVLKEDIVDDLYTNTTVRPLSARQGILLRNAVDKITPKDVGLLLWDGYSLHAQDYYVAVPSAHGLPIADEVGRLSTNAPVGALHCANKKYVDDAILSSVVITEKAYGEAIVITDSANAPLVNLKAKGDTWQKQYEGHQLFDISNDLHTPSTEYQTHIAVITDNEVYFPATSAYTAWVDSNTIRFMGEEGKQYTISCDLKCGSATNFGIAFRYSDGTTKTSERKNDTDWYSASVTSEVGKTVIGWGTVYGENGTGYMRDIVLCEGTVAKPWEKYVGGKPSPSMEYPQPIESVENAEIKLYGKNLYDKDSDFTNCFYNDTTNIITSGGGFKSWFVNVENISDVNISIKSTLKSDYLFWALVDGNTIGSNVINSGNIAFGSNSNVGVSNGKYLMVSIWNDEYTPQIIDTVQIELGSVETEYEPYTEQTITIPYVLRKGDKVDYASGKRTQATNRVVFDGTENWVLGYGTGDGVNNRFELDLHNANFKKDTTYYQLDVKSNAFIYETTGGIPSVNCFRIYLDGNIAYPLFNPSTDIIPLDDLDAWKTYLAGQYANGTPVYIEYELAEPIVTDLTEAELEAYRQLHTNYPTTTILSNAELEVEHVSDPALYIEEHYIAKEQHQALADRVLALEQIIVNS